MPEAITGPGIPSMVPATRMIVGELLEDSPRGADVELVVSELVTNAVLHSVSGEGGEIRVSVERKPGWVRLEVQDQGPRSAPRPLPARIQLYGGEPRESGRGLVLVGAFADAWGHMSEPGRAVFWAEFSWDEDGADG